MATVKTALVAAAYIDSSAPTTNFGSNCAARYIGGIAGTNRSPLRFTMPSLSGTITKVTFNAIVEERGGADFNAQIHALTRSDWVQTEVTWNRYKSGSNWTSAGGDFSGTIIDAATTPAVGNWLQLVLLGTGSDNPITLNWGDTWNGILKGSVEAASRYCGFNGGNNAGITTNYYFEITYTQIKSVNSLLKASVKSSAGLAAANIKSMNGLAF